MITWSFSNQNTSLNLKSHLSCCRKMMKETCIQHSLSRGDELWTVFSLWLQSNKWKSCCRISPESNFSIQHQETHYTHTHSSQFKYIYCLWLHVIQACKLMLTQTCHPNAVTHMTRGRIEGNKRQALIKQSWMQQKPKSRKCKWMEKTK